VDLILVLVMTLILVKEVVALMGGTTAEATVKEILDTVELTTPVKAVNNILNYSPVDTAKDL